MTGHRTDTAGQRSAAKRTAWVLAAIAVAVYCAFLLSGMVGG